MSNQNTDFYLIVGNNTESITSKISTVGGEYVGKRLESKPSNWKSILDLLASPHLRGAIVTLNETVYSKIVSPEYKDVAPCLLERIAAVPHIVFAHEAVFGGASLMENEKSDENEDDDYSGEWNDQAARDHFGDIDETLRRNVNALLESAGIVPVVYKRNAQISALAVPFIDDQHNNLLFRLYTPSGQLFEEESAQLYSLFQDWLQSVRGQNIRQGGYKTAHGRVIEFFADPTAPAQNWSNEVQQFASFLSLIEDPESAHAMLQSLGVMSHDAEDLVSRYSKRLRRVHLDARHERQRRVLAINQELESELSDYIPHLPSETISSLVEQLVPESPTSSFVPRLNAPARLTGRTIQINTQIFQKVEGIVAQSVNGDIIQGPRPSELLELISKFGGPQTTALITATRELADSNAPVDTRISAKQKLKGFLVRASEHATSVTMGVMQTWIEQQVGL